MLPIDLKRSFPCGVVLSGIMFTLACGGGSSGSGSNNNPPPPPQGTQVAIAFSGGAPLVVADQIGTGSWAAVSLQSGVLNLTIPSGTSNYGVAYLCPTYQGMGPIAPEFVLYATTTDPTTFTLSCYTAPSTGTVSGNASVSAIAAATGLTVYGGQLLNQSISSPSGAFSFSAPTGTNDIAILALDSSSNVLGTKFVRSQTVPGQANSGNLISLASSDATSNQTITVSNIPSGFNPSPAVYAEYVTSNGTFFGVSNKTGTQYAVVPTSEAQSTDYYIFSANNASQTQIGQHIGITQSVAAVPAPTFVTLLLPAPLPYAAPTPADLPTFSISYSSFSSQKFVSYLGNIQWFTSSNTDDDITVTATSAYQNGSSNLSIPDLSSVSGFLPSPPSGSTVYWFVYVYGGSYAWFSPTPATGNLSWLQNEGQFTAP